MTVYCQSQEGGRGEVKAVAHYLNMYKESGSGKDILNIGKTGFAHVTASP